MEETLRLVVTEHQMRHGRRLFATLCLSLGSQAGLCAELPVVYLIVYKSSPEDPGRLCAECLSFLTVLEPLRRVFSPAQGYSLP